MEEESFGNVDVPYGKLASFAGEETIPLHVISELFARADMPKDVQRVFWKQAEKKKLTSDNGTVESITTYRDGRVTVTVKTENHKERFFDYKGEMTKAQLDEFKRAQNEKLSVFIEWQEETDDNNETSYPLNRVAVQSPSEED
ncbi:MAG: hypothetical protein AAGE05_06550 [Pseudomonadota bacterium]